MNIGILDSENIQAICNDMLSDLDILVICVGSDDERFRLTTDCFTRPIAIRFVHCYGNGKDNMDHHIMGLIGFYAAKSTVRSIRIISNDQVYANIIHFWRKTGKQIKQFGNLPSKATKNIYELNNS